MAKHKDHPLPEVGEFVVVAHQLADPEFWWVSKVEWAGDDQVLLLDTQGWHPSKEPTLLVRSESILASGTLGQCQELLRLAKLKKDEHIVAIRNATIALRDAQDAAREAIQALVSDAEKKIYGDVTAIEP